MNETVELLKAERNFWKLKWHEVHAEIQKANKGLRRLRAGKKALRGALEKAQLPTERIYEIGVKLRDYAWEEGKLEEFGRELVQLSGVCAKCGGLGYTEDEEGGTECGACEGKGTSEHE